MSDLLEIISTFPKVTTLTILEKQLANRRQVPPRTFVTQEEVHLQVEFPPYVPVLKTSAYNSTGVLNSYKVAARAKGLFGAGPSHSKGSPRQDWHCVWEMLQSQLCGI
jgi:hypothetical protein